MQNFMDEQDNHTETYSFISLFSLPNISIAVYPIFRVLDRPEQSGHRPGLQAQLPRPP